MENNSVMTQYKTYLDKMPDSVLKDYIITRVIDQIDWYDKKSVDKQNIYKRLSVLSIILNGVVPVVVLLSDYGIVIKIFIAALSSTAGILNAVIVLCNYQELWVQYRSNCEALKSILYRFFLHSSEFEGLDLDSSNLHSTLVMCCENLMTKEFQTWVSSTRKATTSSLKKDDI